MSKLGKLRLSFWAKLRAACPEILHRHGHGQNRLSGAAHQLKLRPALCFGALPVQLAGHAVLRCTAVKNYYAEISNSNQYEALQSHTEAQSNKRNDITHQYEL
jgi:hypothetical protein